MNKYNIGGSNVQIAGFTTEIKDPVKIINEIQDISLKCNNESCIIQLLHGKGIAGRKHVLQATSQALTAFDRDENISKDMGLEICVRGSFQRQISRALDILGIEKGKIIICAVTINCDNHVIDKIEEVLGKKDDSIFHWKFRLFNLSYNTRVINIYDKK
jgi:KEOPS complex subunit Cgi121